MPLTITLTFAAAAALINLWLGVRVSLLRVRGHHLIGDAGDPQLQARMRAHANFTEYTPFALVLVAAIELAAGPSTWLWAASALFLLARVAHPFGMERRTTNPLRAGGILVTALVLLALAGWAVVLAYQGAYPPAPVVFDAPPARS